jgi:hypothetical protein
MFSNDPTLTNISGRKITILKRQFVNSQLSLLNSNQFTLERQIALQNDLVKSTTSTVLCNRQNIHRNETIDNIGMF